MTSKLGGHKYKSIYSNTLGKVPTTHTPKHPHGGMLKKGEKGVKTTRKQTKSQAICRMMQDLTFLNVFSSIDLFMDKPTHVRVNRAITAFYKAKGVKHEDWLEKANRRTTKEFKAICPSKALREHGACPLLDHTPLPDSNTKTSEYGSTESKKFKPHSRTSWDSMKSEI